MFFLMQESAVNSFLPIKIRFDVIFFGKNLHGIKKDSIFALALRHEAYMMVP
jgi:hypothetical protein